MPNHVTQILRAEGPNAYERMRAYFTDFDVASEFKGGKREQWRGFDFGKIIERPAIIDTITENGSDRYIPMLMDLDSAYLAWEQLRSAKWAESKKLPPWPGKLGMPDGWMEQHLREAFGDEPIDNAYRMIKCFAETGHKGWYDWSRHNWGTKWNAYSSCTDPEGSGDKAKIKFDTAWDCPAPILTRLAEMEPDLSFSYVAFDEGWNFYARGEGRGSFTLTKVRSPAKTDEDVIAAHFDCYGCPPDADEEEVSDETQH